VWNIEFGFDCFATSTGDNTNALYVEDLKRLLSSCQAGFPNLKVLEFAHAPSCLALKQKKLYFDTVASALLKVSLPTLTELEVAFDITHDFGRFFLNERGHCQSLSKMFCKDFEVFGYTRTPLRNRPLQNRETQDSKKPLFCQNMLRFQTVHKLSDYSGWLNLLPILSCSKSEARTYWILTQSHFHPHFVYELSTWAEFPFRPTLF
jgi:hypothetical protein